jgi:hypothetical protein
MLLHASNHSLALYGQDIDPLAVADPPPEGVSVFRADDCGQPLLFPL